MKQIFKELFETTNDPEAVIYKLMTKIKSWEENINHLRLFPAISEIDSVITEFEKNNSFNMDSTITDKIQIQREVFNNSFCQPSELKKTNQLNLHCKISEWLYPHIKSLYEEAKVIEDYVVKNIQINNINPEAKYRGKGYFIIDDQNSESLFIYKYEIIFKWIDTEPTQIVTLLLLRSIPIELVDTTVEGLVAGFIQNYDEILNPAVYLCETKVILPFKQTVLPIAKNSLLQLIKD